MSSPLDLNPQFEKALDLLENSTKHLFITGKAGTGKSTLLRHFRTITKKKHVVLAPTGIAAVNVDGETIHSFFAIHPGITPPEARKEGFQRKNTEIFRNLDMIIVDEVSMVRADLLDCVDNFLRAVRKAEMPFGGVQMVFIGDLYQLPPVITKEEMEFFEQVYDSPYFFDSFAIKEIQKGLYDELVLIELDKIYRQKDSEFINILNAIRNKEISYDLINELNKHCDGKPDKDYIYLVGTNYQADEVNTFHLNKLHGQEEEFVGEITGDFDKKSLPTDEILELKIGARVMFVKNDSFGRWVNGTLGTITDMEADDIDDSFVKVQIDNGKAVEVNPVTWSKYKSEFNPDKKAIERKEIGTFTQIPLKLAWALTIHKSQGKTFDKVVIDFGRGAFAHGQAYVALSRCTSLEGLIMKKPLRSADVIMDERIKDFLQTIKE